MDGSGKSASVLSSEIEPVLPRDSSLRSELNVLFFLSCTKPSVRLEEFNTENVAQTLW